MAAGAGHRAGIQWNRGAAFSWPRLSHGVELNRCAVVVARATRGLRSPGFGGLAW